MIDGMKLKKMFMETFYMSRREWADRMGYNWNNFALDERYVNWNWNKFKQYKKDKMYCTM